MNKLIAFLCVPLLAFFLSSGNLLAQDSKEKQKETMLKNAEEQADKLERVLDLEIWQTFRVDSTLKHDYEKMMEELEVLSKDKVSNTDFYISIQDKWMDQIDNSFRKIFTDEQWEAYLKYGAGKAQKARAKRQQKKK